VVLEGNNQKQADFLARTLAGMNPDKVKATLNKPSFFR
jgi:hypothetical protein